MMAACECHEDVMMILLDRGADTEAIDNVRSLVFPGSLVEQAADRKMSRNPADVAVVVCSPAQSGKNAACSCTDYVWAERLRDSERMQRWFRRSQLAMWRHSVF